MTDFTLQAGAAQDSEVLGRQEASHLLAPCAIPLTLPHDSTLLEYFIRIPHANTVTYIMPRYYADSSIYKCQVFLSYG